MNFFNSFCCILSYILLSSITFCQNNEGTQMIQSTIIINFLSIKNFGSAQQQNFKVWVISLIPSYNVDESKVNITSIKKGSLIVDFTIEFYASINPVNLATDLVSNGMGIGLYNDYEIVSITTNISNVSNNTQNMTTNNTTNQTNNTNSQENTSSSENSLSVQAILSIVIGGITLFGITFLFIVYKLKKKQQKQIEQKPNESKNKNQEQQNGDRFGGQSASNIIKHELIHDKNNPETNIDDRLTNQQLK